jgi:exopolyphosphatase/guanosine-5'-triphosphate,3'-diphosphate pyrophosphatase
LIPRRVGLIAIGSNSTRMLTADLDPNLSNPVRGREETALFLSMDDKLRFSREAMERVAAAVSGLWRQAIDAGAQEVRMIATSAMRDAANRHELDFYIAALCPIMLNRIISGQEEALLSFLGACCIPSQQGLLGMIDIGGGSTEVALGTANDGLLSAHSLQLGASRLLKTQRVDSLDDITLARAIADKTIEEHLPTLPGPARRWTLVGGTGTTLLGLIMRLPPSQALPEGRSFSRGQVSQWLRILAPLTPGQRAQLPGMSAARVHITLTGLVILEALFERLDLPEITVSLRNNLDGYLYRMYSNPQEDTDA